MNSFGNIIAKYRKAKGYTQPYLAECMAKEGFITTFKSISTWEKDKAQPSLGEFFAICKILEIKDIYEEVFGTNPYNIISTLSDEGRAKVDDYIDLLISSGKYKRKTAKIISIANLIRLYNMPVSAGTGNFLDSEDYEEVEKDATIPAEATFGVKISGDSMMPEYTDGQTVWIQQTEVLNDGEIGIFLLDGNAYCKKLQNNKKGTFLISLNKKYNPIPITENSSFKTFGRVL